MIDSVQARRSSGRDVLSTPDYDPKKVITRSTLNNPGGENLAVLFPPWHGAGKLMDFFEWRLKKGGYAVLRYEYHGELLKPSMEQVVQAHSHIQKVTTGDLNEIGGEYNNIHLFGASLGNVALAVVAEAYPDFTHATLVAAGGDLATATWEGIRTQHIRHGLQNEGVTENELEAAWSGLAPTSHARAFSGKHVLAVPSMNDEIIPSRTQLNLISAIGAAGAELSVHPSNLGHYATIGAHYLVGQTSI